MFDDPDPTVRWVILGIVVFNIAVSGVYRKKARERSGTLARATEPARIKLARMAVGLPMFAGLIAYLIRPAWMAWASLPLPIPLRWPGLAIAFASVPFLGWVLRSIGSNISETIYTKEGHELVRKGPYRWIRHPLYTGGTALVLGIALAAANAYLLAGVAVLVVIWDRVIIPAEERELLGKFGDDYRAYMATTGRWLPRLRRVPHG